MVLTIQVQIGLDPALTSLLSGITTTIGSKVDLILANQEKMMASIQDVADDMTQETTTIAGLSTFIQGLQAQIAALPGITPQLQAQIDGVFAQAEANKAALAAALAANVPPTTGGATSAAASSRS
jgi:hypothetical protein